MTQQNRPALEKMRDGILDFIPGAIPVATTDLGKGYPAILCVQAGKGPMGLRSKFWIEKIQFEPAPDCGPFAASIHPLLVVTEKEILIYNALCFHALDERLAHFPSLLWSDKFPLSDGRDDWAERFVEKLAEHGVECIPSGLGNQSPQGE